DAFVAGARAPALSGGAAVIARDPQKTGDATIDKAIETGDPMDITAIHTWDKVPEDQRLRFIGIINGQTGLGGHLPFLWPGFGDGICAAAESHMELWGRSVSIFGGDPMALLPSGIGQKFV